MSCHTGLLQWTFLALRCQICWVFLLLSLLSYKLNSNLLTAWIRFMLARNVCITQKWSIAYTKLHTVLSYLYICSTPNADDYLHFFLSIIMDPWNFITLQNWRIWEVKSWKKKWESCNSATNASFWNTWRKGSQVETWRREKSSGSWGQSSLTI